MTSSNKRSGGTFGGQFDQAARSLENFFESVDPTQRHGRARVMLNDEIERALDHLEGAAIALRGLLDDSMAFEQAAGLHPRQSLARSREMERAAGAVYNALDEAVLNLAAACVEAESERDPFLEVSRRVDEKGWRLLCNELRDMADESAQAALPNLRREAAALLRRRWRQLVLPRPAEDDSEPVSWH
jgi:hypothetical protein